MPRDNSNMNSTASSVVFFTRCTARPPKYSYTLPSTGSSCVRAARTTSSVRTSLRTRPRISITTHTATLPMAAAMNMPTPQQMPQMMAQKM